MDDSTALGPRPARPLHSTWKVRRRNSFSSSVVVLTKLSHVYPTTPPTSTTTHLQGLHSSSFPAQKNGDVRRPAPLKLDLELLSLKGSESYTSLRDLLPSSAAASPVVNSPTASSTNSGYEISIRNRLVKQAAWAYLQPMSSTSGPSGPNFLSRLCLMLTPCVSFFTHRLIPFLSQAFRRALHCIGLSTEL